MYRSSRGAFCTVIGFALATETSETVVAFLSQDGKHYTMKVRLWLTPTRENPDEKRFTLIQLERQET